MEAMGSKIRRIIFSSLVLTTILVALVGAETAHADAIIRAPNNLGLVGYWSFDEGRGTQASDLSGNGNDGALIDGPTWTTGKSKGALEFDGTNFVDLSSESSLGKATDLSVVFWVKASPGSNNWAIGEGALYRIRVVPGGGVRWWIREEDDGSTSEIVGGSITPETWHHIAATYNTQSGDQFLYIDGQEVASASPGYAALGRFANNFSIGRAYKESPNLFDGVIDEVRIYGRALTETEIQSLYSSTSSTLVGRTPTEQYSDGLVAHWTFDGKHTTATTATDIAGDNDGAIWGGAMPVPGVIGQAIGFDGMNDFISIGNPSALQFGTNDFSYCFWIKTTDTAGQPVGKGVWGFGQWGSYLSNVGSGNSKVRFEMKVQSPPGDNYTKDSLVINDGLWHHVCGTYDRDGYLTVYTDGVSSGQRDISPASGYVVGVGNDFLIADGHPGNLEGSIDDVRVYNRAITAAEVLGIYTSTKPSSITSSTDALLTDGLVGLWTFNDGTIDGTAVTDVSGNGNNGVITGATPVAGVIGQAMEFGVNDQIVVPHDASMTIAGSAGATIAVWWRPDGEDYGWDHGIVKKIGGGGRIEIAAVPNVAGNTRWEFAVNDDNGTCRSYQTATDMGQWVHITGTFNPDDNIGRLYQNGILVDSFSCGPMKSVTNGDLHIGKNPTRAAAVGRVDDVRIYNRALTQSEVEQLYSMGQ